MSAGDEIRKLLRECSVEEKHKILQFLRTDLPLHPLEKLWNVNAERILEAVHRSSDLTKRGVRGVIAEATFVLDIVPQLTSWRNVTTTGDFPYDCLLVDTIGEIRVQIKMQRLEKQFPKLAHRMRAFRLLPTDCYIVETQRTRGGQTKDGEKTRPYRFEEFDILGVCLHPSTNNWQDFVYTPAPWLIPSADNRNCIATYQPVSATESEEWTRDFNTCVTRFRSGIKKRLFGLGPSKDE
jgi:hypothetical protein